jgi:hypothetical protein
LVLWSHCLPGTLQLTNSPFNQFHDLLSKGIFEKKIKRLF